MGGTFTAANAVRRAGEGLDRLPRRAARTALGENAAGRMIFRSGRAGALLLLVACAALIMAALRNRGRHGALTGDALALLSLYALFHYGVYAAWLWTGGEARYRIYYLMPQMMLLAAALAAALAPPLVRRLKSSDARTVATALGMLVLVFHLSRGVADTWRNYQVLPGPVAERYVYGWIGLNLPENAVLGARDAGKLGFFSGRPVVNLDGLANDQRFLAALRHGTVAEYIAASPIEYLLFGRPWVGEFDPLTGLAARYGGCPAGHGRRRFTATRWDGWCAGGRGTPCHSGTTGPAPRDHPAGSARCTGRLGGLSHHPPLTSDVLVEEDGVAVGVHHHEAGRSLGGLVGGIDDLKALGLEVLLQGAHVGEFLQLLGVLIPAGIEGHEVVLEHPVKQADDVIAVLHDQPVLLFFTAELGEPQLFVKNLGGLQIRYGKTHRKRTQFHGTLLEKYYATRPEARCYDTGRRWAPLDGQHGPVTELDWPGTTRSG
jgi:hypothetical protein